MTFVGWGDFVPIFLNQIFEFEVWGKFGSVQWRRADGSFGFSAPIQCIRFLLKGFFETSPSSNPDLSIPLCPSSSHTTHDLTFHCVKSVSKLRHLYWLASLRCAHLKVGNLNNFGSVCSIYQPIAKFELRLQRWWPRVVERVCRTGYETVWGWHLTVCGCLRQGSSN